MSRSREENPQNASVKTSSASRNSAFANPAILMKAFACLWAINAVHVLRSREPAGLRGEFLDRHTPALAQEGRWKVLR